MQKVSEGQHDVGSSRACQCCATYLLWIVTGCLSMVRIEDDRGANFGALISLPTLASAPTPQPTARMSTYHLSCTMMSLAPRIRITVAASQQYFSAAGLSSPLYGCCLRPISSSTPTPKLAYEIITDGKVVSSSHPHDNQGKETIVFLHGLLGNAKNLRTPAKKLTRQLPHLSALLLDVRGHGGSSNSQHLQPHNFHSCVQDIFHTLKPLGLVRENSPTAICGHSLGGRIALQYTHTLQQQEQHDHDIQTPKHTWILDSVPGTPDPSVHQVLKAISSIPLPIACKSTLTETLMSEYKMNKAIAQWIASNLKGKKDNHTWVFDLEIANELVDNFADQKFSEMIHEITSDRSNKALDSTIQLVMAGRNKEWKEDIVANLQAIPAFGDSFHMHKLENAGHWVHVDAVNELTQLMVDGLSNARR